MGPDIKLSDITETNDHPRIMFLISVNYKILLFSAVSDKLTVTEKNSLVCCSAGLGGGACWSWSPGWRLPLLNVF